MKSWVTTISIRLRLYCDGKLYVPIFSGKFYIIDPSDKGAKILHALEFEGSLIGSPVISNGHLYLHTTRQLYCWKFQAEWHYLPEVAGSFKRQARQGE